MTSSARAEQARVRQVLAQPAVAERTSWITEGDAEHRARSDEVMTGPVSLE